MDISQSSKECFEQSPYYSLKVTSYFHSYDLLFGAFQNKPITFVEVGVLSGGSLFMWRRFFGPHARIIGIDLNPEAKKWEKEGFEIHIGNQQSRMFWKDFYQKVGHVDILLDDGGHTYAQQIITLQEGILAMPKGLIVIEDTHTSHMNDFGAPSDLTFLNFSLKLADQINANFEGIGSKNIYVSSIQSIGFHPSLIAFAINRGECATGQTVENCGERLPVKDFRHTENRLGEVDQVIQGIRKYIPFLFIIKRLSVSKIIIKKLKQRAQLRDARQALREFSSASVLPLSKSS